MREHKLIVLLIVFVTATLLLATMTPIGAQSTSPLAVSGQSAQKSPINPALIAYDQNKTAGKVATKTAEGNALGHTPGPVDLSHTKGKQVTGVKSYSASYDLRTVGKVSSVKNQLPYGSCWAFGTFGSLESYLLTAETRNFSENNLVLQSGFDDTGSGLRDDGGNHFMSTAYLARWSGPKNEADDPYPGGDVHAPYCSTITTQKHVQNVYWLPDRASATDNNNIKSAIMTYGGLDCAFYWDGAYYNSARAAYYCPYAYYANHEVTVVGWDDNYQASNFTSTPGGPGAWLIKNSWGTSWGNGGYFWLSYYDPTLTDVTAYTAESASNYATNYQYDPLGWVGGWGSGSTTTYWGANVFTANSSESLSAVGFYSQSVGTQYEVYVYTGVTSGPSSGTQHVGPTGTIPMVGYYTIKLSSPVSLTAGQKFSVVVKSTTPGYNYPVPGEWADYYARTLTATGAQGQSYISPDGTTWSDIYTYDSTATLCIKAYTSGQGGGWGPWTSWGGQVLQGTSPGAYSSGGTTGVFVVGNNHQLYWSTGSGWTSLGGYVTSSPAAASSASGVIDVFVRGNDGALYQRHYSGSSWGGWISLGGTIPAGSSPAASSWGSGGRLDVFVRGMTNALYQKTYTGSWSAWQNLGGTLTSSPGAVSRQSNVIDVFVRGSTGAVYQKTYSSGSWSGWTSLGGTIPAGTTPAASGWTDRLDLFVQGTTSALYQKTWTASGGWGSWSSLGGTLTSSPAATAPSTGHINVFVVGASGALYEKSYTGG